jgi:hypothetical protein
MIEVRYSRDVLTIGRGLMCRENKLGVWVWCAAASVIDFKSKLRSTRGPLKVIQWNICACMVFGSTRYAFYGSFWTAFSHPTGEKRFTQLVTRAG